MRGGIAPLLPLVVPGGDDPAVDQGHRPDRARRRGATARRRLLQGQSHGRRVVDGRPPWSRSPSGAAGGMVGVSAHVAEAVGFEPTVSFPTHDFQSCRFGRSRTPPDAGAPRSGRGADSPDRLLRPLCPPDGWPGGRSTVVVRCRPMRCTRPADSIALPRRWVRRLGPAQRSPVNRVRVGRQQLSAGQAVCRSQPGRRTERRGRCGGVRCVRRQCSASGSPVRR